MIQRAPLLVLRAGRSKRLDAVLAQALAGIPCEEVYLGKAHIPQLSERRVLFALSLGSGHGYLHAARTSSAQCFGYGRFHRSDAHRWRR